MLFPTFTAVALASIAIAQNATFQTPAETIQTRLRVDNGTYGPDVEEIHYCEHNRARCRPKSSPAD